MKHLKRFLWVLTLTSMVFWTNASFANEIVIGFTGPLSGPAAEYGEGCVNGIDLAIKEINAAGGVKADGVKWTFRLERMDDKVSPHLAQTNARELLDKTALAIFNPVSTTTLGLLKINEEECGEFITMAFAGSSKITAQKNDLLIAFAPLSAVLAQIYADMAWERGWRKAAMVVVFGDYGNEWRETFRGYWEQIGGTITIDKAVNYYTRTDFVAPLTEAVATKPDVMLIGGPTGTTALVIEQARNMGYQGGFLILDQANVGDLAKLLLGTKLMENTIGPTSFGTIPIPYTKKFDADFREQFKKPTTWEAVFHYTAMHALAKAIEKAGTQDNVYAVRAAFNDILPASGASKLLGDRFPVEFNGISPAGRIFSATAVQTVKDGKFTDPDLYAWFLQTPEEIKLLPKAYHNMPLKIMTLKIGKIE